MKTNEAHKYAAEQDSAGEESPGIQTIERV